MKEGIFLTGLYLILLVVQPFFPSVLGDPFWLLSTTPILITYVSIRSGGIALVYFIILSGLLHDLMFPDYLGMGPLLWGMTAFIIHSQLPWLSGARFSLVMVASFVASFFYLCMDRLLVLFYAGFWTWTYELSFAIFMYSFINALLAPLLFWVFDFIFRDKMEERKKAFSEWARSA